jgi:uncharacterized protein
MSSPVHTLPMTEIVAFCERWKIRELAAFGSILRPDFGAESDIDLMATFDDDAEWSLLDHFTMEQELQALFHRDIDLVTRYGVENSRNWLLRREILDTASVIYTKAEVVDVAG